jgi:ABC-type polysaccharide/polyol phosphate transport system ATPase subunit
LVALENVSFDIAPGTALGVIGPNGAGKSTLLKILSGVLSPTNGEMSLSGRISSIIELGAGFHPEFSGRDNVLMNAELHGLTREEALGRLESIADFSELGRYFDMPVRTYSSGMFVRLAFSLAVAVDPQVLLVDEALAVGDAVFVHRCLNRIRELRESGVTIVLVTHDTATVAGLCDRALLIHSGQLAADGPPKDVIHRYLVHVAERLTRMESGGTFHAVGAHEAGDDDEAGAIREARFGSLEARIVDCWAEDLESRRINKVLGGDTIRLAMSVEFDRAVTDPIFGVMIRNRFGVEMFGTNTHLRQDPVPSFGAGDSAMVRFELPMMLDGGAYGISFAIHAANGEYFDYRTDAVVVEVVAAHDSGGLIRLPTHISVERQEASNRTELP